VRRRDIEHFDQVTRALFGWWLQRDSNPRFGLERVATRTATTWTYRVVAMVGCHAVFE
jgi:hypothetical protein